MSFTEEMDEKLIELVRVHPVLYDLKYKSFKNNSLKDNLWTLIASKLDKTENECKSRWRSIRDTYRKIKTKGKYKCGSTAPSKSKYNSDRFAFLDAALKERQAASSIPDTTGNENEIETQPSDEEDSEGRKYEIYIQQNEEGDEMNFDVEKDTRFGEGTGSGNLHRKRKMILKDRGVEEIKKSREDTMAMMKELIIAIKSETTKEEHPIEVFFRSMAKTVMRFSPELIAETRIKVCQIVTEMELRHLYKQGTPSSLLTNSSQNVMQDTRPSFSDLSPHPSSVKDEPDII